MRIDGTRREAQRHDTGGAHQVLFPAGLNEDGVLLTASGHDVEVQVIVLDHGQVRGGRQLSARLRQVDGACTPLCEDAQFAVQQP